MSKIQILITDNNKLHREMLTYVLNTDPRFEVLTECTNLEETVSVVFASRPDIILLSIGDGISAEISAIQQICNVCPATNIIGISSNMQPAFVKKMMQNGLKGYITRNTSKEEMIEAIAEVSQGKKFICNEVKNKAAEFLFFEQATTDQAVLTRREIQVINCLREGMSSREMAAKLDISLRTVEVHRYNILRKLKLKNAASVIHFTNNNPSYVWSYGNS